LRIKLIRTKDDIHISPNELTIVIGANDTGKSTFIREVFIKSANILTDPSYRWRWVDGIELFVEDKDIEDCREILNRSVVRNFESKEDAFELADWRNEHGEPAGGKEAVITRNDYNSINTITAEQLIAHKQFRTPFFVYASCESRLTIKSPAGRAPMHNRAPDVLNLFHRREKFFDELVGSIEERFHYNLLLLEHIGTQFELGTSSEPPPDLKNIGDKNDVYRLTEEWKRQYFTPIQESGHGLRSMVRILEALFDTDKKIKLIDEPEMHLYPAQKIWVGGKIAELSSDDNSQTIVSTHDAHVLQGILDKRPKVTILRFSNTNGKRSIHQWTLSQEPTPTTDAFRADFLTGLFHNYCVTVESDSDRLFYKEMMQGCPSLNSLDVAFVPCRGEGGTLKVARLSQAINQPSAFILDLDVVFEKPKVIRDIIEKVVSEQELPELTKLHLLVQQLKLDRPDDKWKVLVGYTDRKGPGDVFMNEHGDLLRSVISELANHGVFMVPGGSLESWAPEVENKARFPENAPNYIRNHEALHENIKIFLQSIGKYLVHCN